MNEKAKGKARENADRMIDKILSTQPELLKATDLNAARGKEIGEFIISLRDCLTEEYAKNPPSP